MDRQELSKSPIISLVGAVDSEMIRAFDQACKDLFSKSKEEKPKKVVLVVTSGGGSVNYSLGLSERIRLLSQEIDVTFLALGVVYSAGVSIMLAIPKEKRITTPGTSFLIHTVQYSDTLPMKNTIIAQEAQLLELLSDLEHFKQFHKRQLKSLARDMDVTYQELDRRSKPGWYLDGREAVKIGLVGSLLKEG